MYKCFSNTIFECNSLLLALQYVYNMYMIYIQYMYVMFLCIYIIYMKLLKHRNDASLVCLSCNNYIYIWHVYIYIHIYISASHFFKWLKKMHFVFPLWRLSLCTSFNSFSNQNCNIIYFIWRSQGFFGWVKPLPIICCISCITHV